ncbi:carbohydrate kinase family protein [Nonomuraea sp. LPB2021202275-12-8]|uniref:carbohydrate kinase family protein n=1 Tax=Nonomuraea sp. LPB2021202275-12-8 TaxID=3120159 RepID=UPI00300CCAA9
MIVVCGEALVDLVPLQDRGTYAARPGGSPANVSVGLGRLGIGVTLLSRIADDGFGRLLRAHLTDSRVDLSIAVSAREPTTLAVVTLDPAGGAEYVFYVEGSADGAWQPAELPGALPDSAVSLHVSGSLALAIPAMGDTLELLLRRERPRRTLTFDPNLRPQLARDPVRLRTRLDQWIAQMDVVKISSDDLAWLVPGEPIEAVAAHWHSRGPVLVVVTRGAEGVHAIGPAGPVDLPGSQVRVADTVGAGDAFMSGLLAALDRAGRLPRDRLAAIPAATLTSALAYAQQVAAITCTRTGSDPPWQGELNSEDERR